MSLFNLIKLSYWFSLQPPLLQKTSFYLWLIIGLGAFLLAAGLKIYLPKMSLDLPLKKFLNRLSHPLFFLGIISLIFLFFRQENAYFLSARFWLAIIGLSFIAWAAWLAVKFLKSYKQDLARLTKEKEFRKYLPR